MNPNVYADIIIMCPHACGDAIAPVFEGLLCTPCTRLINIGIWVYAERFVSEKLSFGVPRSTLKTIRL
jgi:hypothetical protein